MRLTMKDTFLTAYSKGVMRVQFLTPRFTYSIQVHDPTFYLGIDCLFDLGDKCLIKREDTP